MTTPHTATPPIGWLQRLHDGLARSLHLRIVVLFLALLLAVQAASFVAIRASIEHNARVQLHEELVVGERLLKRLLEQNAQKLVEGASLLATDYGFRSAVSGGDDATIGSVLANHGERIGANVTALLDTRFHLRASGQSDTQALLPVVARLAALAPSGQRASETVLLSGRPYQMVMVPMRAPVLMGWVVMGFPLDQRLVDEMRELSSLHVNLEVRDDLNAPWSTALSTLPREARVAVERQSLLGDAQPSLELRLPDGDYAVRALPLGGGEPRMTALLMRSIDDAVAPYRQLQWGLLGLTLAGVVVFAFGSVLTARHVTTPIRTLMTAAERLGAGDYRTPLGGEQRTDEIGNLAQAFERMRVNVAHQQDEILKLAYWDSLTGLPNRVQFRNAVMEAIALGKSDSRSVAVIMLDLDRFKHVNDVLGYRHGDLLLKGVAERLSQQTVRHGDLVARLGGDEFAVLLADLDPSGDLALAQSVARRLHEAFGQVMTLEDHSVDMSASFGVAVWPHHAAEADSLLSRAEVAMYSAKRRGEGPMVYDPALDATSTQTLSLLSELRRAVDQGELRLYLQPKLALESARVVGAEALVRWQHPQRGLVPPVQFIPFAEQTGFIRTLTMWVFEEAAQAWRSLNDGGLRLVISINLSTRDLLDQELPQKFEALLVKHRAPAEAFCLEITESAIMDDPQRALATLDRLSQLGFKLSIDDFGTGYSSLAYLKRLPVDELKIDKSFVLSMEKDLDDARIVRSTIDLAHGLGLSVVAEGVENAQVWDMLRELSCDEAQGYHMGKPMPAQEFTRWSGAWAARQALAGPKGGGHKPGGITFH